MKRYSALLLGLLLIACSDDGPVSQPEAALSKPDPTFMRFTDTGYQAAEKSGSFWAVRGESRDLVLRYTDSDREFMRFHVGASSLVDQDSVLISVQVDPTGRLIFHFSPSGLRFNSSAPALLFIDHARTNPDLDADGDVDLTDTLLATNAGIWKRDLPLLPWVKIPSLTFITTVERADIYDFTSFGMAVD